MSVPSLDSSAIKREGKLGPRAFSQGLALAPAHTQDIRWLGLGRSMATNLCKGLFAGNWLQQLLDKHRPFLDVMQLCFDSFTALVLMMVTIWGCAIAASVSH